MKFARIVFLFAGLWGIVELTPLFFLFGAVSRRSPSTNPELYYAFLAVTMAWQFTFLVIASNPGRFRLMMIPSVIEKVGYVLTLSVLSAQGRIAIGHLLIAAPDLLLGALFTNALAKTSDYDSAAGLKSMK